MGTEQSPQQNSNAVSRGASHRPQVLGDTPRVRFAVPRDVKRWPDTEGYPPVMGGAGRIGHGRARTASPIVEQLGGVVEGPEQARRFFELFFSGEWIKRSAKTGRKLDSGHKSTVREANRLRRLFPEIYEEVRQEMKK